MEWNVQSAAFARLKVERCDKAKEKTPAHRPLHLQLSLFYNASILRPPSGYLHSSHSPYHHLTASEVDRAGVFFPNEIKSKMKRCSL